MEYTDGTLKYNVINLANKSGGGTPGSDYGVLRYIRRKRIPNR